jgi:hypothetical protein
MAKDRRAKRRDSRKAKIKKGQAFERLAKSVFHRSA